ncbi:Ncapd2 [Symbiodinium sp. CCMP2592]|nr:Ncapd2 [Symbiodinium sp. CCMP2592]
MQDRQQMAGAVNFWQPRQEQQLPTDTNWFGNDSAPDGVTPAELALLQRHLNDGSQWQWWGAEAPAQSGSAPAGDGEWAAGGVWPWQGSGMSEMNGAARPAMEAAQAVQAAQTMTAMASEGDWSAGGAQPWNWQGTSDVDAATSLPQVEVQAQAPSWSWDQGRQGLAENSATPMRSSLPQVAAKILGAPPGLSAPAADVDPDKGLAEQMSSAVALFLAGADFDEADSDEEPSPEPVPSGVVGEASSTFGASALDAPPFVPGLGVSTPEASQKIQTSRMMPDATATTATTTTTTTTSATSTQVAEPATPETTSSSGQTTERTELRLDDILPKEATPSITSPEGLNDFFAILRQQPLPADLANDPRAFSIFTGSIAKHILILYKKRLRPTVKLLQSMLRETGAFTEEIIQSLLLVCARDVPKIYSIRQAPMGGQPVVLLTKPPMWFQGFQDDDLVQEEPDSANTVYPESHAADKQAPQQLASADSELLKAFHGLLWDESMLLPKQITKAALELQRNYSPFVHTAMPDLENVVKEALRRKWLRSSSDGLRPSNFGSNSSRKPAPIGPLAPGAYPAQAAGGFQTAQREQQSWKHQASSETSNDGQEKTADGQDSVGVDPLQKQDVSGLLNELMLLFPTGMRFAALKEHLKASNDGHFSENSFLCPTIANEYEGLPEKVVNGGPTTEQSS